MLKKILFIVSIIPVLTTNSFSQSDKSKKWNFYNWYSSKPSIEVTYGSSFIKLNGSSYDLANAGMFELKLGFSSQRESGYSQKIVRYKNRYLFLSNASSKNSTHSNNLKVSNDMWRFGFGNKDGYGLNLGSFSILPYNSNSFDWSEFNYVNPAPADSQSINYFYPLNDFNDAFRFGRTAEAGINFQITKGFSIQPEYEVADIFPRHLFGKQFMSSIIQYSGLFAIEGFTKLIMKNTPVAGTIVNFILVNAYEYGFYQLCKNQMYWPFTSVAPLRYETLKLGMTFTF